MKQLLCILILVFTLFGTNITIDDGQFKNYNWYKNNKQGFTIEDNEIEPYASTGQKWDLEGLFLNDNKLSMLGGFNFRYGNYHYNEHITAGDIFIDIDGLDNGYDFVLDMDYFKNSYDILAVNQNSEFTTPTYNVVSGPVKFISNGDKIGTGNFNLSKHSQYNYEYDESKYHGDRYNKTHYLIENIDMSFLNSYKKVLIHHTMTCGNDNLMGYYENVNVDESGSGTFLFLFIIGYYLIHKRK